MPGYNPGNDCLGDVMGLMNETFGLKEELEQSNPMLSLLYSVGEKIAQDGKLSFLNSSIG
jgi:hypothetical protein